MVNIKANNRIQNVINKFKKTTNKLAELEAMTKALTRIELQENPMQINHQNKERKIRTG